MSKDDKILAASNYAKNRIFALKALAVCVAILGYLTYTQFTKPLSLNETEEIPNNPIAILDTPQTGESEQVVKQETYADEKTDLVVADQPKKRRRRKGKADISQQSKKAETEEHNTQEKEINPPKPKKKVTPTLSTITTLKQEKNQNTTFAQKPKERTINQTFKPSKQRVKEQEKNITYTSTTSSTNKQSEPPKNSNYHSAQNTNYQVHRAKTNSKSINNIKGNSSPTPQKTTTVDHTKPTTTQKTIVAQKHITINVLSAYKKGKNEGVVDLGEHSLNTTEKKRMNKGLNKNKSAIHINLTPNKALKENNSGKLTFIISSSDGKQIPYTRPFTLKQGKETNLIIGRGSFPFKENKSYTITILAGKEKVGQSTFNL